MGVPGVKKGVEHEYDMPLVTTVGSSMGERGRRLLTITCQKKHGVGTNTPWPWNQLDHSN
jgi:hypothetical protein